MGRKRDARLAGRSSSAVYSGSGTSRAEGRCDLLDGFCLRGTHALPSLFVGGSHLVGQGEDEAAVVIAFLGGRLAIDQCHRVVEVPEPVVVEFFGRVVSGVVGLGSGGDDLIQELAVAMLGARF